MPNYKFFPFAPNIPYQLYKGKYIKPEMDFINWNNAFDGKDIALICYGGFIETITSLCIAEALHGNFPKAKCKWIGSKDSQTIRYLHGICKKHDIEVSEDIVEKYPVPLFFNKKLDTVYVNCLNNYLDVKSYTGSCGYKSREPIMKQIFQNSLLGWNKNYFPKFRKVHASDKLNKLCKTNSLNLKQPYVLLMPDDMGVSIHKTSCLDWTLQETRSFASMIRNSSYNLVIITSYPERYYGIKALVISNELDNLLYFLINASAVVSNNIDFSLTSLLNDNGVLFATKQVNEFSIKKNAEYIKSDKRLVVKEKLSPLDVFEEL